MEQSIYDAYQQACAAQEIAQSQLKQLRVLAKVVERRARKKTRGGLDAKMAAVQAASEPIEERIRELEERMEYLSAEYEHYYDLVWGADDGD